MVQISSSLAGVLLFLAGLLAGIVAYFLYARREAAALRSRLAVAEAAIAQHQGNAERLQAGLGQAEQRLGALDEEKNRLDREQAHWQAEAAGLRERLAEARQALTSKEQSLYTTAQRLADAEKELSGLQATHAEKLAGYEELKQSLEQSRQQLKTEFQNLANQILEEKGKTFAHASQASLDALLKPFREQIHGFQQRINQVHDESVKGNAALGTEIKQVLEIGLKMSTEANTLATALRGEKKTTGNWGEIQLERSLQLAGLMPGDHYEAQAHFKDEAGNHRHPDFIVKLPDDKHMVIDSKVSLVDYDRAIGAESEAEQRVALDAHAKAVRNHIDDLSRKDYSNLIGMRSPSFVLMFMPIEPAYIEALKHNRDLFDYGYQRNVVMVSHTTLMPILRTVANLWRIARSNQEAHELGTKAGEIYNQVVVVAENLKKLGDTLGTVSNHYNKTVTSLAGRQGLYGKASRFNELSAKANKTMPDLEPLHTDFQTEKLELIVSAPLLEKSDPPGQSETLEHHQPEELEASDQNAIHAADQASEQAPEADQSDARGGETGGRATGPDHGDMPGEPETTGEADRQP
ncbi:DNA recombination protein RmuC [Pusillimonas noertemannii]|uniref:DNA recombination protein RmuC n=1 Tax=Pusillimonas noertemannii TaxID=305977 RepID=A0A2U1CNC5_9BURK|nr:DNA recombination protein RmuC [Pusillimonas noertemannii]PVY62511.1 DNA recombination protein RmuC [Pusillimonas noertemannii]